MSHKEPLVQQPLPSPSPRFSPSCFLLFQPPPPHFFFALLHEAKPAGSDCLSLMEGGLNPEQSHWESWAVLSLLFSRVTAFWSGLAAPGDAMAAQHQPASPLCQVAVTGQDCGDRETLFSQLRLWFLGAEL